MKNTTKKKLAHAPKLAAVPPLDHDAARVAARRRVEDQVATRHAHDYRVLANEREGSPLRELPTSAVAAYALGTGDGDIVDTMLEEIAIRLRILGVAANGDGGIAGDEDFRAELYMLSRRAEAVRELARRRGVAPKVSVEELGAAGAGTE